MTDWTSPASPLVDWTEFDAIVESHSRFLLTTHINPDGDGLGSEVALALHLQKRGKHVRIVNDGHVPFNFEFLHRAYPMDSYDPDRADAWFEEAEVVVILDTSTRSRIGRIRNHLDRPGLKVTVVDHHVGEAKFADLAVMTVEACATGELVYDYIRRRPETWNLEMAEAVYTAVVTDTGSFRFSNTDPPTHAMAAHLVNMGVQPEKIATEIYRHRHADRVRFLGDVLQHMQLNAEGSIAWLEITRDQMERFRIEGQDTEGIVDFPRTIPGVEVVALFTETNDQHVKVSLRSAGFVDVSQLAGQFGGGGHRVASGALLRGTLEESRSRILTAAEEALAPKRAASAGA